jgi:diguanylate cyclase (GGDEF)-like protein
MLMLLALVILEHRALDLIGVAHLPEEQPTLARHVESLVREAALGVFVMAVLFTGVLTAVLRQLLGQIEATNRRLEARLRELTLLFDLNRSIGSTLELGELLRLITEMIGVTLGFSEFAVLLVDEASGELEVKASYGFPDEAEVEGVRFASGEGVSGEAARSGEYVLVRDVAREPRFLYYRGRQVHGGSFLSVPMKHKEKVVGVLNFSRPQVNGFTSEEIKLLISVASQAALAIANALLYQETVELSLTDPLTGIHNRRHLFARLDMELARAQRFNTQVSVLVIDIDHFKRFNDSFGHPAGDEVLKGVARVIESSIRRIDTVARVGGEEFVVVLPGTGKADAGEVAEKLRRAVERTSLSPTEARPVTISLGFCTYPSDGADAQELVEGADRALYAAKRAGRNRVTAYEPALEPRRSSGA